MMHHQKGSPSTALLFFKGPMYYLVEFENQPLYEVIEENTDPSQLIPKLSASRIITTDSYLESYMSLIRKKDSIFYYYKWTTEDALNGKRALNDLKEMYNYLLIFGKWDICGKLRTVTKDYFQFRIMDGTEIYLTDFVQGDSLLTPKDLTKL